MDFIWNASLKNVQVQSPTQKMPKKESKSNQKRKMGQALKSVDRHMASADRHFHGADWHGFQIQPRNF